MQLRILVLAVAVVSGCAVSGPRYENDKSDTAACIWGDIANLIRLHTEGEAHVQIVEVDGVPARQPYPICVKPGSRRFGVTAYNPGQAAQDYVELDLEARKKYKLRANLRGISFLFQLVDITTEKEQVVSEFRLKATPAAGGGSIPVIVPVK